MTATIRFQECFMGTLSKGYHLPERKSSRYTRILPQLNRFFVQAASDVYQSPLCIACPAAHDGFGTGALPHDLPAIERCIDILQFCKDNGELPDARRVQLIVCSCGLESHFAIGNDTVLMFLECASTSDAHRALRRLHEPNVRLWTSLMWGYIWSDEPSMALNLYWEMQNEGMVVPSTYTFVAALSACVESADVEEGRTLHAQVVQMGYGDDRFVGSTLVDMYAKFNMLSEASQTFHGLSVHDIVSWTALMTAYAEQGRLHDVLVFYQRMLSDNISPNAVALLVILKTCINAMNMDKGREFHHEILLRGYETETAISNMLIDMYSKNGSIHEAMEVFDSLLVKDGVAWSTLIAGYVEADLSSESLCCFLDMCKKGITINTHGFVYALKACGSIEDIKEGQKIHVLITKVGYNEQIHIGNALVGMYAKCSWIAEAQSVFDRLLYHDIVTWNALITGFAEHGPLSKLLESLEKMNVENVSQDAVTYVCILKGCGNMKSLKTGREVHMEVICKGFEGNSLVEGILVDMYAKCGTVIEAQKIFDSLSTRNIVLWNSLIAGYADSDQIHRVSECLSRMQTQDILPNHATYVYVLKAFSRQGSIELCQETHMQIEKLGLKKDYYLGNTLIETYAKHSFLEDAVEIFNNLEDKTMISWNIIIDGYAEHGPDQSALDGLMYMQQEGIFPDTFTFAAAIKACGNIGAADVGSKLHTEIICKGFETEIFIGSTLMDMYRKCDLFAEAENIFQKLPKDNIVSWNTAIASYAEHGSREAAWQCFEQMQFNRIPGDPTSYISILKSCVVLTTLNRGRMTHTDIVLKGFEGDIFVASALVGMYANCSALLDAHAVFAKLQLRNTGLWNTMVKGYCMNHESDMAIKVFRAMQEEGVDPDAITMTCLITACSRTSQVDTGQELFKNMQGKYGIIPNVDHFSCIVDLLSRSGRIYEAEKLLQTMPCSPATSAQRAILTACKTFESFELGHRCYQQLVY